jgi:hypothetical protein
MTIPIICKQCGKTFHCWPSDLIYHPSKYCSIKCHGLATRKENNPTWSRIKKTCQLCGKFYEVKKSRLSKTKYCSQLCHNRANSKAATGRPRSQEFCEKISRAKQGSAHPRWKGERRVSEGYVIFYLGPKYYKKQARIKAEKAIGRKLKSNEIVHHINGNRSDDRNSNLLICTNKYHAWLHGRMKKCVDNNFKEVIL